MKRKRNLFLALLCVAAIIVATAATVKKTTSKNMATENNTAAANGDELVKFETTDGDFTVRLFGDTPKHRDNFLKLVDEGYYDGVLFHRVINDFMIQTGDPDSKNAPAGKVLGSGGPSYEIDAEFVYPTHFHKRGALAAARQGDNVNPQRKSSGSQFYVVTGKVFTPEQLQQMEQQRQMMQKKEIFNELAAQHHDSIMTLRRNRDQAGLAALQDELIAQMEVEAAKHPFAFTPEQVEAYTTVGGTPHLDGQYTVFGEVVDGLDVIGKIEKAETDGHDRPVTDIRIISAKRVK